MPNVEVNDQVQTAPTPFEDMEGFLNILVSRRSEWEGLSFDEKASCLEKCCGSVREAVDKAAEITVACRGCYDDQEERFAWSPIIPLIRGYILALKTKGRPPSQGQWRDDSGKWIIRLVGKSGTPERTVFGGVGEIWIQGKEEPKQGFTWYDY